MKLPSWLWPPLALVLTHNVIFAVIWVVGDAERSTSIQNPLISIGGPTLFVGNIVALVWLAKAKLLPKPLALLYLATANTLIITGGIALLYVYGISHFGINWPD